MEPDSFLTIAQPVTGQYREKGSRFLAFAYPVNSADMAREALEGLRRQYPDASHHCFAYVVDPKGSQHRASDDGEPAHTAGAPILGQIKSRQLTNVLIVVVRYFGGIKLGAGGLVAAYRTVAAAALDAAEVVERHEVRRYRLTYDYALTNTVTRLLTAYEATVVDQRFTHRCEATVEIKIMSADAFERRARRHANLSIILLSGLTDEH